MHLVRWPWGWDGEAAGLDGGNILCLLEWQANILCPYLFGSGSIPLWFSILDGSYQGISFNMYREPLVEGALPGIGDAKASLWWSMSQTPGRHTKDTQSTIIRAIIHSTGFCGHYRKPGACCMGHLVQIMYERPNSFQGCTVLCVEGYS